MKVSMAKLVLYTCLLCVPVFVETLKDFSLARYNSTAVYANNSVIDINLVGEGFEGEQITDGGALECHTDDTTCCRGIDNPNGPGRGEWYYPDGTVVPSPGDRPTGFYRTRGHKVIRLNRIDDTSSPTGVYQCEIPGAGGVNITKYFSLIRGITCNDSQVNDGAITYAPPYEISAKSLLPPGQHYIGTIATYSCSPGYQLVGGSSLRACGPDGTWNGTEPSCEELLCNITEILISNGEVSLYENNATYICDSGYELSHPGVVITCDPDSEQWNSILGIDGELQLPTCNSTASSTDSESPLTTTTTSQSSDTQSLTPNDKGQTTKASSTKDATVIVVVIIILIGAIGAVTAVLGIVLWRWSNSHRNEKLDQPLPESLSQERETQIKTDPLTGEKKIEAFEIEIEGRIGVETSDDDCGDGEGGQCWEIKRPVPVTEFGREISEQHKEFNLSVRSEECDGDEGGGLGETNRPVPVTEFGAYVSERHAHENTKFTSKFESLDNGEEGHTVTVSRSKENKKANRFKNITVYDANRIVLRPLPGEESCQSDYINGCYVDGYSLPRKFIATQGPLPNTVVDFWRMVWQERPSAIVMLANCEEGGRVKCEQYWPESGKANYRPFQVIITDKQILADYTVRSFIVMNDASENSSSFKLTQFHFTAWPDHGIPEYATPILALLRRIRSNHVPSTGPLIVHCSAGVGRTGTYIAIDNVFDQIKKDGLVDIDGVIVKARKQRMKMVQSKEQYIFIHDAILEFITCGDTQISSANFRMAVNSLSKVDPTHQCTGYQHQFNVLDQVSPSPSEVNCPTALSHPDKNRGDKYLPAENSRVILIGEQPDYIHAVTANAYKHQKAYIIAQNPLRSTVRNFWKVIIDKKCSTIVMLSNVEENGKESCAVYWPEEGETAFKEFKVDITGKEECPGFTVRKLVVSDFNTHHSHQVTQFHVTNWSPDGTCSNLKVLTDVIEEVAKVQRRTRNKPILVHCSDTVSRSGMFCAIATTIDCCKTKGVVDVFQVVKALRIHKPGAVLNVEQYKLIHEAVLVYLEMFDTYANFQAL